LNIRNEHAWDTLTATGLKIREHSLFIDVEYTYDILSTIYDYSLYINSFAAMEKYPSLGQDSVLELISS
jgi:hypothetical protein